MDVYLWLARAVVESETSVYMHMDRIVYGILEMGRDMWATGEKCCVDHVVEGVGVDELYCNAT